MSVCPVLRPHRPGDHSSTFALCGPVHRDSSQVESYGAGSLSLAFPEHHVLKVRPCCSLCQSFVWLRRLYCRMGPPLFTYQLMDICVDPTFWLL